MQCSLLSSLSPVADLMTSILAIDTSTDACSVALLSAGTVRVLQEHAPRRHNQLLLGMLRELLPGGPGGLDAVAYGCGPGSFTGLRIAASAAQGICFAAQLPALPVSTLAAQVQSAIRLGLAGEGGWVLSTHRRIVLGAVSGCGWASACRIKRSSLSARSTGYSRCRAGCGAGWGHALSRGHDGRLSGAYQCAA